MEGNKRVRVLAIVMALDIIFVPFCLMICSTGSLFLASLSGFLSFFTSEDGLRHVVGELDWMDSVLAWTYVSIGFDVLITVLAIEIGINVGLRDKYKNAKLRGKVIIMLFAVVGALVSTFIGFFSVIDSAQLYYAGLLNVRSTGLLIFLICCILFLVWVPRFETGNGYSYDKEYKGLTDLLEEPVAKKELSPQVRCVAGEYMGGVFPISKEEPIQIGRDSTWANLVLASEKVSDRQVSIRYLPEKDFFMITNYSEEGTFLRSGECLIKNVEQVCLNGVILCFGDNKEQFRLEGKKR